MANNGNGLEQAENSELPAPREAIVEQGLRIQQETAAERDELRREVFNLKSDIAAYKVAIEALQAQVNEAASRVASSMLVRDQAVDRAVEAETVLASIMALGRAFNVKSSPLVADRGTGDDDVSTMSANDRRLAMAGVAERYNAGDVG